jgi:transposase InsO family protein
MRITGWSNRYQSRRDPQTELRIRLRDLAGTRIRYGYRRLTVILRREGWRVNTKRVYRLYREEALQVRTKKRVKRAAQVRITLPEATFANQRWSMDFVSERLADGRWFRILTIVDQYTRECLCMHADRAQTGGRLRDECLNVEVFLDLADARSKLDQWRSDYNQQRPHSALADRTPNEFASVAMQQSFSLSAAEREKDLTQEAVCVERLK